METVRFWSLVFCLGVGSGKGAPTSSTAGSSTTLTLSSDVIYPGLTKELRVTCSFPAIDKADVGGLLSLVVSRVHPVSETQQDIVAVNSFDGDLVVDKALVGSSTLDYSIQGMGEEGSFVSLHWMYPNRTEVGYYECEANALDKYGHPVRLISGSVVQAKTPDITAVAQRFRDMMKSLDSYRVKFEGPIDSMFISSDLVNSSTRYLLSKHYFGDVDLAQSYCNWAGGHLAEINSQSELEFLLSFVAGALKDPAVTYLLIGLSDETKEGDWVFPSTGLTADFTNWYSGEPNTASNDCAIVRKADFIYYDTPCTSTSPYPFICEVKA